MSWKPTVWNKVHFPLSHLHPCLPHLVPFSSSRHFFPFFFVSLENISKYTCLCISFLLYIKGCINIVLISMLFFFISYSRTLEATPSLFLQCFLISFLLHGLWSCGYIMDYPNGPLLTNVWVVSSFVLNHHQCHSEYAWVTSNLCLMPCGLIPGSGIVGVTGDDVSPCAQACGFLGCWSWAMLSCKVFCLPSALLLSPFFLPRTRQLVQESAAAFSPPCGGSRTLRMQSWKPTGLQEALWPLSQSSASHHHLPSWCGRNADPSPG